MLMSLYGELCFYENLLEAFRKAAKGKSGKCYVMEFRKNTKENLLQLQKELVSMTYEPQPMKTFVICDPKTRVISASAFRDRIVHHALCNVIEPIFDKSFIFDSCANRKGKDAHLALERFDKFKKMVSGGGKLIRNAKDNNMVCGYALKADIKHYFDSVNHEVLIRILKRKIKDDNVMWLIQKILSNHNSDNGMPIGNLTSQFFANVYLNELDYFVKHRLKAKCYIRYVDDFVILNRNKEVLAEWKISIDEFLKSIKLELHPEKSRIYPLHKGINLLGFRVFYHFKLLYKRNIRRFDKRLESLSESYRKGEISRKCMDRRIEGWLAYAKLANTYNSRRRIREEISKSTP
jgi:retron-type reverse transcriptase